MVRSLGCLGLTFLAIMWADYSAAKPRSGKKALLTVEGTTIGAKVLIDGKEIGKTPLKNKEIAPGTHSIVVKKLGYLDFTEKIQAKLGKPISVFADLLPFAGVIKVSANVAKASVTVDGKPVGKVPLEYEVKLGQHTVTVNAPGYASYSQTVSAEPGNEYEIKASLVRGGGKEPADGGLELALVPLAGSTPGGKSSQSSDRGVDDLALAPLPKSAFPPSGAGAETLGPIGPTSRVNTSVEPVKPWYMQWWAWSAAAAVVVTGVSVAIWAGTRNRGGGEKCVAADGRWAPANGYQNAPYEYSCP